jgi:Uma2 family endonuclease
MTARTLISTEEYLGTAFSPDVDFVEGALEERNAGEKEHGTLQGRVWFLLKKLGAAAFLETRLRISATRYRVPDICAYAAEPNESIFTAPPLLCVEILSPDDRMSRILRVVDDYLSIGALSVWVLDPLEKKAFASDSANGFRAVDHGSLTAGRLTLTLDDVFSDSDLFA